MAEPIPSQHCPLCGKEVGYATSVFGPRQVKPGDISICGHCAGVTVLDDSLMQREATDQNLRELSTETLVQILRARDGLLAMQRAGRN